MDLIDPSLLITAVGAYFAGSIPFGLVITKIAGAGNLREIGSGNIGATIVLRTGKKGMALLTLILDMGKGWLPVFLAGLYQFEYALTAGLAAVIGHIFPIWLRFRGGKGVATTIGVLVGINWLLGLLTICSWLIIALVFRYSSLAAILALALSPLFALLLESTQIIGLTVLLAVFSVFRHLENIQRLIRGKETKINLRNG